MPVINTKELIRNRVAAIQTYHESTGIQRAQLDVSGGVDSAVMLGLLARAVGPENITAVYSGINSSKDSASRAYDAAHAFKVELFELDLTEDYERLVHYLVGKVSRPMPNSTSAYGYSATRKAEVRDRIEKDPTILGSFRSTLRAPVGRFMNRLLGNGIRHGTGNECEDRWLRFYQKGGDGEVDTNPIAMLSKGEVYQLAVALGVPESILTAVPSPDLQAVGAAHNDEDELRSLYGVDWTYSKVNLSGEYTHVGTIEKISRLMDLREFAHRSYTPWKVKFAAKDVGLDPEEAAELLQAADDIDRITDHKYNPNCPSLGDRDQLLKAGILTNNLPVL